MAGYLLRRVLSLIPVLLFVSLVTFALGHLAPGGPFDSDGMQRGLPPETVALLNRRYRLDEPLWRQYLRTIGGVLRGDLGPSTQYQGLAVRDLLFATPAGRPSWESRLGRSAQLGLLAAALALLTGLPCGMLAALRRNSWADYASLFVATCGVGVPSFVLGICLLLLFGVKLRRLPVVTTDYADWRAWVLPAVTLAAGPAGYIARLARAALLETLGQDCVRTARAKGLAERTVLIRHALPAAMLPVVTVLGPAFAGLVTGSFFVESVFSFPGAGRLYVQAVAQRDYAVVMGTTLLYAELVALTNLAVDLLYRRLDPRIAAS